MKVAYVVISHRSPQQVLRLVRVLAEGPAAHVLVGHDQRAEPLRHAEVEAAGGRLLALDPGMAWGAFSQLELILWLMEAARRLVDPDWLLTLSGQDYPLRPLAAIEADLERKEHDALLGDPWELDLSRRPPPPRREFFLRYAYAHFRVPRGAPRVPGRLQPLAYTRELPSGPMLGLRRPRLPFGEGLRCFISGDWFTLSRRALDRVLAADPRLLRFYRRAAIPSESFVATVLLNDSGLDVARGNRRYARFSRVGAAHPDTLTSGDLDELLGSGCDFARKFDSAADRRVLELLDERRGVAGAR